MKTKEEQKEEAKKAYEAIVGPAQDAYEAIINPAWKAYEVIRHPALKVCEAIVDPAREIYLARLRKINEQGEDIKIINGKRYKLVEEE